MQHIWTESGNFWQRHWETLLDIIGEEPITLWIIAPMILTISVYWIFGALYTALDIFNKPDAFRKYKVQPGTNEPVDLQKLLKVMM